MVTLFQSLRRAIESHPTARKFLLGCGIVAPVWWVAMDVVASLRYEGYSYVDQTISELSAEGAPTRSFLVVLNGIPYFVLMTGFGVGIWASAGRTRAERITGALLIAEAFVGMAGGLLFPMAQRGTTGSLRNAMHVPYGIAMPILFLLAMGFGSRLFGTRFRYYTYATILTLLVFGALTGLQASRVESNEPTPWLGIEERANAYAAMIWLTVLAVGLLRAENAAAMTTNQSGELGSSPEQMQPLVP